MIAICVVCKDYIGVYSARYLSLLNMEFDRRSYIPRFAFNLPEHWSELWQEAEKHSRIVSLKIQEQYEYFHWVASNVQM